MEILSRPLYFRAISAATGVLLALGLIGAVTVEDDVDTVDATAATTTTVGGSDPDSLSAGDPAEPGEPAPGEPGAPRGPGAPAAGGASTTAVAPAGDASPGAAAPTRPGLYRYKVNTNGEDGRSELRVTQESGAPAGEQRLLHRKTADGNTSESSIAWQSGGIFERSRTLPGGGGGSCDWEPDVLLAPRPLGASSSWSWDSRCESQIDGQQASIRFTGQARVVSAQRVSVGGRPADVWQVQSSAKLEISGSYQGRPFTVVVDITSDDLFAPQQGIVVRSDNTSKASSPGQPPQETHTIEELQNLDPA